MQLENWEPNLNNYFSLGLVASRRGGKSTLIKYLLNKYLLKKYDETVIICNSINNDYYDDIDCIKITQYDDDICQALLSLQDENKSNRSLLIVFDDCISNKMKYSNNILQFFSRGRHSNISVIFSTQTPTLMSSDWKENLDYMIVMRQKTSTKRHHIIENFLMGFIDNDEDITDKQEFNKWKKIMSEHTQDHGALVCDFINDGLYKFKAEL